MSLVPQWTQEEDFLLLEVFRAPNLDKLWNQRAKKEGWPRRSLRALKARVRALGESNQRADESAGWVTGRQLQRCLGTRSNVLIRRWQDMGLPVYKDGIYPASPTKIHLADFVNWALDAGCEEIAYTIRGDQMALQWLLRQIADWKDYKVIKPHGGHHQARPKSTREYHHAV